MLVSRARLEFSLSRLQRLYLAHLQNSLSLDYNASTLHTFRIVFR